MCHGEGWYFRSCRDFISYFTITEYDKDKDVFRVSKLLDHVSVQVTKNCLRRLGVFDRPSRKDYSDLDIALDSIGDEYGSMSFSDTETFAKRADIIKNKYGDEWASNPELIAKALDI
jgi:hypothetical protein